MGNLHPFLKWVGSKRQLLPELLKYAPKTFGTYYEPFVGGGALFFELQARGSIQVAAVLSDLNADLINTYTQVRDHVDDVIRELCVHRDVHGVGAEAHYLDVRVQYNKAALSPVERAGAFIYMNKTGFNGLFRVNAKGEYNTPWGKHEKYEPDEENLRACSDALQGVELKCADFRTALAAARLDAGNGAKPVVYADPPYFPVSTTADFTGYTKDGFGFEHQHELARGLYSLVRQGAYVVASNADVKPCRDLYLTTGLDTVFTLHEVQARRAVNCKGEKRGKVGELIITGGGVP